MIKGTASCYYSFLGINDDHFRSCWYVKIKSQIFTEFGQKIKMSSDGIVETSMNISYLTHIHAVKRAHKF